MRSTATLSKWLNSPAGEAILEVFDILFTTTIAGPLSIIYWKVTWNLMDIYIYPKNPFISATITTAFGLTFGLLIYIFQEYLSKRVTPDIGKKKFFFLTRLYTYCVGVINIATCRGVWNILDCLIQDPISIVMSTALATMAIISVKAVRNVVSAPFCVILDLEDGYFDAPTFYRKSSKETALYILDCVFSVAVVGSLVVFVWRGSWALLDIFLCPDNKIKSFCSSLIIGYTLVFLTFAVQAPMKVATARLQGAGRLLLADAYHLVSFLATVNVWRGVWGLLDAYLFPDNPKLSNWCSHIVSLTLLIVLNCSNSIIVRGVYIDAEEPEGDCVVFPCHYLRYFMHKEKAKKRHKSALAAAAATRRLEEASVPLQIPEEKV